jgi:hypothetical protein
VGSGLLCERMPTRAVRKYIGGCGDGVRVVKHVGSLVLLIHNGWRMLAAVMTIVELLAVVNLDSSTHSLCAVVVHCDRDWCQTPRIGWALPPGCVFI